MKKAKEASFGMDELKYYLFNKKRCRICGGKMKKIKEEEYKGIEEFNGLYDIGGRRMVEMYETIIYYYCEKCNRKLSLEDLAEEKKKL